MRSLTNDIDDLVRSSKMIYILAAYILGTSMKVSKWGNSLAIRFPKEIVDILRLKEGDDIEITTGDSLMVKRKPLPRDVLARLRKYRGMMPEGWKFDRDEANER